MEMPQDMETMRSFLGLVNYFNRFSPHLAELSDLLREICKQQMEFKLTAAFKVTFQWTKVEISKNITLPYFNPNTSTISQTDASKGGVGAVHLQNSTPVMFASRALTRSKRNYQNLEWECLAMIWGMEKFQYFLYGKEFIIENRSKATCVHLQEAHGGNFLKDPQIDSEKLPISAFQCTVQERSGNSTSRCTKSMLHHYQWKSMEFSYES